jgi:type I restriction enzyme S subunit
LSNQHFVPTSWRRISLESIAHVQTGIAKGKKNLTKPVDRPYLRVANVQDGHLDTREIKVITVSEKDVQRYSLRFGDVLMTEGGDFDKLGRGLVWEDQIPGCLHQNHVFAVRPIDEQLDSHFLSYQASSSYGKRYFLSCSKQSTNLASINSTQLKQFPVLLPPHREQRKIVNAVQTWDRALLLTKRLIAAKQEQRTGLMQKLLSRKLRLPGFTRPWTDICIGDFLSESRILGGNGKTARKLTVKLYGRGIQEKKNKRTGSENTKYYVRRSGQFIYSKLDFLNGAFAIIPEQLDLYESTLDLPCFDIGPGLDAKYLLNLVSRETFYSRLLCSAAGGRKARRVNPTEFLGIKIHVPELDEQTEIVRLADLLDREISLLEKQLDALKEQKKGLMQQLLTGKIRVKTTEELA